ncbi:MAG: AraC family transcriptional regulator [Rhodospirillaceae bacterium]|nr:AraC family transcriptional regulator [Rhodospirillaceae bacterium]
MPLNCAQHRHHTILAAAASGITGFITKNGGDAENVCDTAGVNPLCLDDPHAAIDLGAFVTLYEHAAENTRCDNFGLIFGQSFRPESLGLIGAIALAAPTLGAAITTLAELFPFHQQATETRIGATGGLLTLEYRILDGSIINRRQDAELTMGMFANIFRHTLGTDWAPEQVFFEHPCPADGRLHQDLFGADICFGQRTNALVFRNRDMDRRMPKGDLARLDHLRRSLIRLSGSTGTLSLLDRIKGEIRSRLPNGIIHVDAIAEALGFARWTLQRRLSEYGVTFSDILDTVRRDLAALYLRQPHIPLSDIGFYLGYSEHSAFTRAHTRWFGVPPHHVRHS